MEIPWAWRILEWLGETLGSLSKYKLKALEQVLPCSNLFKLHQLNLLYMYMNILSLYIYMYIYMWKYNAVSSPKKNSHHS